jgi:uncharacterized protein (DUF952 family)/heme-degrading monooxygenase HmoA
VSTTEPYVAVIFTSQRSSVDPEGYAAMAERMDALAREQPGYRGIETARNAGGASITVSYWATEGDASAWKQVSEHLAAQNAGRDRWYDRYHLRVATVTREYEWVRPSTLVHMAVPGDWAAAQAAGEYRMSTRGVTLEQEGFIHCSFDHQLQGTANRFYADVDELVLLRIDPSALGSEVVVEPPFPGSVEHIPLAAVVSTTPWRRGADGWQLD